MSNRYRLIKEYAGSPRLGNTIDNLENDWIENYSEFWEEVVEKDYEILSFISRIECIFNKNSKNTFGQNCILYEDLINDKNFKIHSVKRLSDGEIFTIGDLVECEYCKGKITSLEIYGNDIYLKGLHNNMRFGYTLCKALDCDEIPQKVKQPLFTTEDGVDIFENNTSIYHVDKSLNIKFIKHKDFKVISKNVKYFSTKEKAEEYILMNKPVLSLKDLMKFFPDTYIPFKKGESATEDINTKSLEKLVQQKLNK